VEADLQSGRTHQLRVHFQFIGHSVAGDRTYGNGRGPSGLRRQFVHAASMKITSPHDGAEHELFAPLPADLRSPLERLRMIRGFSAESLPPQITAAGSTRGDPPILPVPGTNRNRELPTDQASRPARPAKPRRNYETTGAARPRRPVTPTRTTREKRP